MRLKYYLRGAGIGVTITTLILTVAFAFTKDTVSDEEIIRRAEAMGYVKAEDMAETASDESVDTEDESLTETEENTDAEVAEKDNTTSLDTVDTSGTDETASDNSNDTVVTYVPFTVEAGQSSNQVSQNLYKAGLVDDSTAFNQYMTQIGVESLIQVGTFYVKTGSSYDDLVAILVTKQSERDNVDLPENGEIEE